MDELLGFTPSPERDPDGSLLRGLLRAHARWLELRTRRSLLVHASALAAIPAWVMVAWPRLVPRPVRGLGLALWAGCALATTLVWLWERRWRRIRAGYLTRLGAP